MSTPADLRATPPITLADEAALEAAGVGTKAATLARLTQAGYDVPPGVVMPVGATPASSTALQEQVRALGPVVAVRSSAVAEDLADASFAGQYATVLGVDSQEPEALQAAINQVLASTMTAHARAYVQGRSANGTGMAVLIQRQIDVRAAGVAFSADPLTGDDVAVVSAVLGLGEALVSGEVTPEDWRVGVTGTERAGAAAEPVITTAEAAQVADLARRVAADLDAPVDIEWALSTDGDLWLLQARPITALPRKPHLDLPTVGTWEKDTAHLCEPLTPIAETMWVPPLEAAFRDVADTFGLLIDGMEFRCFGGELYSHAIPPGGQEGAAPPWWVMGIVARIVPSLRRKLRVARQALDAGVPEQTVDRWYAEWRPELVERIATLRGTDLGALDDAQLLAHLEELSALYADAHRIHFMLFIPYLMGVHEFAALAEQSLGWTTTEALALLDGLSDSSSAPTRDLQTVAAGVAAHPRARAAILGWDGEPLGEVLATLEAVGGGDAATAIRTHFDRFGCRVTAFDPGLPTIDERPGLVLGVLRDLVAAGVDPDHLVDSLAVRRTEGEQRMQAAIEARGLDESQRQQLHETLAQARKVWPVREDNLAYTDGLPSGLVRRAMLESGRRLAEAGILREADDACWLEYDEVRDLLRTGTTSGDESPAERVLRRRAERAWMLAHPLPVTLGAPPEDPPNLRAMPEAVRRTTGAVLWAMQQEFSHAAETDAAGITGIPSSPGRYTGPVRIVRSDRDFGSIRPGDVLVCPITTPAWSLNFSRIGALVTDAGGALSHAAIVAREHGIPAVLATGRATTDLTDGQLVTVDGVAGTVAILEGASA
jgi:phosphohistidine swiveling domain-containing protein